MTSSRDRLGLPVLCLLPLLAGCVEGEWVKADATEETRRQDMANCHSESDRQASFDAYNAGWSSAADQNRAGIGAMYGDARSTQVSEYNRRYQFLLGKCMREHGYALK